MQTTTPAPLTKTQIIASVEGKLQRHFGCEIADATVEQIYQAVASTVRDEIMEKRTLSRGERKAQKAKKLYYMSAEFLVGRTLTNNMLALGNAREYAGALSELGVDISVVGEQEPEPGLGNGGLGRLAACFLDSLATLKLPAMGCSIRYEYGLFRQRLVDGHQVELPDIWLDRGNVWEICRPDQTVEVRFGGRVEERWEEGKLRIEHVEYKSVLAVPYDMPVMGYGSTMVDMLRLWSAKSPQQLDMAQFNRGQYTRAMEERELAEVISKVLYPEDNHYEGKELRLKQHYFFAAATVGYAVSDFESVYGGNFGIFPDKVALHINDTHPGLAIPELMRILIDEKGIAWEEAERIARATFAYTNHTVMQEALERWPEDMLRMQLPRVYSILEELNRRLCERLWKAYPGQWERIGHMAILAFGHVQMANLCVSMCHKVNGVSAIHGDILKRATFRDYYMMDPVKFTAITNGVTHRRWLMDANPGLAALLDEAIGDNWRVQPERLCEVTPLAEDAAFREKFAQVKRANKQRFAAYILAHQGTSLDTGAILDVQAKRLHEYKRQLLSVLNIMMLYNRIVTDSGFETPPRAFVFAAKAAPGYQRAKLIIRLIGAVSQLIAAHPRASRMLQVVFLENYNVSGAEILIPAAEVSEQLSTAGKEASGTGNMKFMMNGALTIGTMDGANIEISQAVGRRNIYVFGLTAAEVEHAYAYQSYHASEVYETHPGVRHAMEQLIDGTLSPGNPRAFQDIYHSLLFGDGGMADPYFVLKDLPSYARAQQKLGVDYGKPDKWWRMAVLNTAASGIFSSDRTIAQYNRDVWQLTPLTL